jgi:hypothetical protein
MSCRYAWHNLTAAWGLELSSFSVPRAAERAMSSPKATKQLICELFSFSFLGLAASFISQFIFLF